MRHLKVWLVVLSLCWFGCPALAVQADTGGSVAEFAVTGTRPRLPDTDGNGGAKQAATSSSRFKPHDPLPGTSAEKRVRVALPETGESASGLFGATGVVVLAGTMIGLTRRRRSRD